ncbi:hypothetical protein [Dankookia sp. P2]|uniref:hypothetical protein n=1 Tax=Dankookia sp. P2 TaxID=3423955 RepID=UPI003D66ABC5
MSNIAGKAYAMNVLTPIRPGLLTWLTQLIFWISHSAPSQLAGLLGLKSIHFARWVVIPGRPGRMSAPTSRSWPPRCRTTTCCS